MKETKIFLSKILRIVKFKTLKTQGNSLPQPLSTWWQNILTNPSFLEAALFISPEKAPAGIRGIWERILPSSHISPPFWNCSLLCLVIT